MDFFFFYRETFYSIRFFYTVFTFHFPLTHEKDILLIHDQDENFDRVDDDVARYKSRYQNTKNRSVEIRFQWAQVYRSASYATQL